MFSNDDESSSMPPRATLVQVAQKAGVSLGSASRALHGSGASQKMVEKVRAAAAELEYRPHASGRSLRTKKTYQVAFAVADIGNPVYVEMLTEIHRIISPHGYRVLVLSTGSTQQSISRVISSLDDSYVDGLIISPLRVDDQFIEAAGAAPVPVVAIGRPLAEHGLDTVSTDSTLGISNAVHHVLATGRTEICFLNGPFDTTPGQARQLGYDNAVAANSFRATDLGTLRAADFTVSAGAVATRRFLTQILSEGRNIDAIIAANDLLAIGAMHALREHNLNVPADVAVTGMDNTELGRVFQPSLTSVSLGAKERGRLAAELILSRVQGEEGAAHHLLVGPELIARESTHPSIHRRTDTP